MSEIDTSLNCNFCGKNSKEVKKLVAGPDIYICDECVEICYDIIHDNPEKATLEGSNTVEDEEDRIPSPRKIKDHLDQYVIGQDDAKETIAVAVYSHYKRLENIDNPVVEGVEIEKSNILMLGPTGSGKTLIAQSVAKMLNVPLAIADATSLTEAGYVGEDVESIITRLLQAADYNVKAAERGIVFIDEIDKKRGKEGGGASKDVSGEGVQQGLLKLLEGSDVMVPAGGKRTPGGELLKVNTRNILFIVGGAFVGLDKLIERTSATTSGGMGFNSKTVGKAKRTQTEILRTLEPEHLVKYGLIPELIGRLPVYATLEELDEPQLVRILTEPKNSLVRQFEAKFKLENVELVFTPEALSEMAKVAKERKTGARGLRSVVENCLKSTQFVLPELANEGVQKVIVTGKVVRGEEQPERHSGKDV